MAQWGPVELIHEENLNTKISCQTPVNVNDFKKHTVKWVLSDPCLSNKTKFRPFQSGWTFPLSFELSTSTWTLRQMKKEPLPFFLGSPLPLPETSSQIQVRYTVFLEHRYTLYLLFPSYLWIYSNIVLLLIFDSPVTTIQLNLWLSAVYQRGSLATFGKVPFENREISLRLACLLTFIPSFLKVCFILCTQ